MATKRIVAASMRRALEIAREQLGESAIILSTRKHADGVELFATHEVAGQVPEDQRAYAAQTRETEQAASPLASDNAWQFQDTLERLVRETPVAQQPAGLQRAAEIERARQKLLASGNAAPVKNPVGAKLNIFGEPVSERFERDQPASDQTGDLWASQMIGQGNAHQKSTLPQLGPAEAVLPEDNTGKLDELRQELASMRQLLAERLSETESDSELAVIKARLLQLGLPAFLCERLVAGVNAEQEASQAWAEALALLAQRLPVNSGDPVAKGGIYAFVGPTGVGKTTTLAKLAVRYALANGTDGIALISMDHYRLAAHEQLNALGQILGIPVSVPAPGQTLAQLVASLTGKTLILVDTAGLRPGDERLERQQSALASVPGLTQILVMAANSQVQSQKASYHAYSASNTCQWLVLSKLDEAQSLGDSLGLLLQKRLPVIYTTAGQEIPQDLTIAKGHKLVAAAVQKLAESQASGRQQLQAEHL